MNLYTFKLIGDNISNISRIKPYGLYSFQSGIIKDVGIFYQNQAIIIDMDFDCKIHDHLLDYISIRNLLRTYLRNNTISEILT